MTVLRRNGLCSVLALLALTACSAGSVAESASSSVAINVVPPEVALQPGASFAFDAAVTGTINTAVQWTVMELNGGVIDTSGRYTAPQATGTFHVVAAAVADPSVTSTATADVTFSAPPPSSAACATAPLRATGAVYYYCDCGTGAAPGCVPGNDANAGTSASAPRRTIANAVTRFNSMAAGSTIALCRGGAFSGGGWGATNGNCGHTDATWCDFRDDAGAISAAAATPWSTANRPRWNPTSDGLISFGNNAGGYRIWNIDIRRVATTAVYGLSFDGGPQYADICNINLDVTGTAAGVRYTHLNFNSLGNGNGVNAWRYVTIRNSRFAGTGWFALGGALTGLVVDSNLFEDNGWTFDGLEGHQVYLCSNTSEPLHDIQFINNELRDVRSCQGVRLVVHCHLDDLLIANNKITSVGGGGGIYNNGCYGIGAGGSAGNAGYNRMKILRNRITTKSAAVAVGCCSNCEASDNVITDGEFGFGTEDGAAGGCGIYATTNGRVYNNSLYETQVGRGQEMSVLGSGHTVGSNAVWTAGGNCYDLSGSAVNQGNYCRVGGGTAVSNVWVDVPNGNFTPKNPGPLIGTGSNTYYSPTAIGSTSWSAIDAGRARTPPVDAGAVVH